MKWEDIKIKTEDEARQALDETRSQLVDLRFKAATGALKQVHQIKKLRRAITRLITRLAQIKNSK